MATRQRKTPAREVPSRHVEIETKLEFADGAVLPPLTGQKALSAVGLVTVGPEVVHELDAVYYDTAGLDLLRTKLTLRRRTGGDDAGWHLKLPGGDGRRTEVRVPLTAGRPGSVPLELADLVRGAARGRELIPVARLQNRRVVRHLQDRAGDPQIEIADDAVTATPLRDDGGEPQRWRELEVEIVSGTRDQLAAAVEVLKTAGATAASSSSKLGRALPLPPDPAPLPRKSAGAAVVAALSRQRDLLLTADRALREQTQPDQSQPELARQAVHDARRTARRIRSLLKVFGALIEPDVTEPVRTGLRDLGRVLGQVRDLDVLLDRLTAELVDEPEDYARPARARLASELSARSAAALAELQAALSSPGYLATLRALDDLLNARRLTPRAKRSAGTEYVAAISAAWRRLRTLAGSALADPDNVVAVHEVRKAAKSVRYATEAGVPVLGEPAVLFASAVEEIQEVLGEHGDAVRSAELLADLAGLPDTDGISGFVFGRLHAMEQAIAHGALDDFADAWDRLADGGLAAQLGG